MRTFEYKVMVADDVLRNVGPREVSVTKDAARELQKAFEKMGMEGWELVSVNPLGGKTDRALFFFKRERAQDELSQEF